ncbi:MAG: hypothetical protein ACRDHU_14905, partial [Actinomycetota bacterium]
AERLAAARRRRDVAPAAFAGGVAEAVVRLGELEDAGATWAILLAAGGADRMELIGERLLPLVSARGAA